MEKASAVSVCLLLTCDPLRSWHMSAYRSWSQTEKLAMSHTLKEYIALDAGNLPQTAQELVRLIGPRATATLIEQHGGKELTLYRRGDSQHLLGAVIGFPEVETLYAHFGSSPFIIPRCTALLRKVRNAKIHAMFDDLTAGGMSSRRAVHRIIDSFGLTERQIFRIFKVSALDLPEAGNPA